MDKRIIEIFLNEPEREFHVREIARIAKKSPTTISKYLKQLEKEKILKSEKKFNHLIFKAAETSQFKQAKLNYNLNLIKSSGLVEFLTEEFEPGAIILFGSFAKAENIKKSDIDLLIITSSKKQVNLERFENKIGNKIQLFIHSKQEIEKIKERNPELVNSWINGIKLSGFFEVFK